MQHGSRSYQLAVFLTLSPILAFASGLRVPVDNGLGVAGAAGGAALAEDATTGISNPAGLPKITHPELVVAVNPAFTTTEFKGTVTVESYVGNPPPVTQEATRSGTAKGHLNAPLMVIAYSHPLTEKLVYGFGFNNPFGQSTDFPEDAITASTVTEATLITWNISNALGYQLTPNWSIGAGLDVQRLDFLNENIFPAARTTRADFYTKNTASDWAFGWHAGIMYEFNEGRSRLGFNYRSGITHKADGDSFSTVTVESPIDGIPPVPIGGAHENKNFSVEFDLPPIYSASFLHHVGEKWKIVGTAEFNQWSVLDAYKFKNLINVGDKTVKQSFKNTWNFALGAFYNFTEDFRLSGGVKYDNTPMNDKYRGPEFPDANLWVVGMSGRYIFNKVVRLEVGYSHSFFEKEHINNYDEDSTVRNTGTGRLYADVINTQLTINLAPLYDVLKD